jgi:hypothetical protein
MPSSGMWRRVCLVRPDGSENVSPYVRSEVSPAVIMKNVVFKDVSPCGSCRNRRYRGTYRLHLEGENNQRTKKTLAISAVREMHCDRGRCLPHSHIVINVSQSATVASCC